MPTRTPRTTKLFCFALWPTISPDIPVQIRIPIVQAIILCQAVSVFAAVASFLWIIRMHGRLPMILCFALSVACFWWLSQQRKLATGDFTISKRIWLTASAVLILGAIIGTAVYIYPTHRTQSVAPNRSQPANDTGNIPTLDRSQVEIEGEAPDSANPPKKLIPLDSSEVEIERQTPDSAKPSKAQGQAQQRKRTK
jgi:hypothetical protein